MRILGIAGLQLSLASSGNLDLIASELRRMKMRLPWVSLAVLSELAVHGVGLAQAEAVGGETEQAFAALARELELWLVPGSFYQRDGDKVLNATPVFDPTGACVGRYAKMFPFRPYEVGVDAGAAPLVFEIPGVGRIGLSNCYDMWFPETVRTMAAMGAELVVHPSLTNTVDRDVELSIARANAAMSQLYFLDVNGAGDQGLGRSGLYGPGGEIIYQATQGRDIMAFELDLDSVRLARTRGWHGLGQMLKSFRDSDLAFPLHAPGGRQTPYLRSLGPLERPTASGMTATDKAAATSGWEQPNHHLKRG